MTKLFISQFSPAPCFFLTYRPKYFPMHLTFIEPCIIVITEELKSQLDATYYFIVLLIGSHVSGTIMPIIRSSRL